MTIVVGYVPTDEGRTALRLGVKEALLRNARLLVVCSRHVDDATTLPEISAYDDKVEAVRRSLEREVESELDGLRAQLDGADLAYEVRAVVPSDNPSADLTRVAAEVRAEFIVIGLRRRTAVGKLLMGSNAQRILLEAPCPVIAAHATPPG